MSAAANEARAATVTAVASGDDLVESQGDAFETKMTYGDGKMPWLVIAVWVAALAGFTVYVLAFLFPDLSQWGKP